MLERDRIGWIRPGVKTAGGGKAMRLTVAVRPLGTGSVVNNVLIHEPEEAEAAGHHHNMPNCVKIKVFW